MRNGIFCLAMLLWLTACTPQTKPVSTDEEMLVSTEEPAASPLVVPEIVEPSPSPDNAEEDPPEPEEDPIALPEPNEIGDIMIIMYHGLTDGDPGLYDRTIEDFKNDLQIFYEKGYRLINMGDLINNHITVEAGYTPLVLTFDDGRSSAFSLMEEDGGLTPETDCAVDVINKFNEEHPDFGRAATFYINGKTEPFKGAGTLEERFQYLLDNGYDIGNHTYSHSDMSKMNAAKIQEEIGRVDQLIKVNALGYIPHSIAYPFGVRPKEKSRPLVLNGEYKGETYEYAWALRAGPVPSPTLSYHVKFDATNVSRLRPSDDSTPDGDIRDLGYCLRYYDEYPETRYFSDGDPERISVPGYQAYLINEDAIGEKELFIYNELINDEIE